MKSTKAKKKRKQTLKELLFEGSVEVKPRKVFEGFLWTLAVIVGGILVYNLFTSVLASYYALAYIKYLETGDNSLIREVPRFAKEILTLSAVFVLSLIGIYASRRKNGEK